MKFNREKHLKKIHSLGGIARAKRMTKKERTQHAIKMNIARWANKNEYDKDSTNSIVHLD